MQIMPIDVISVLYIGFFGAVIGSFLNVVALRFISGEEIVRTPSHCPTCKKNLVWYELIPVISFLLQGGKCRGCKKKISIQYPIVEGVMAISAVSIFWPFSLTPLPLIANILIFIAVALLVVLSVIDLKTFLLPDIFIWGLVIIALIYRGIFFAIQSSLDAGLGIVIGSGFLYILWILTRKRGIGFGDIKLMIPVGALLGGRGALISLFIAFVIGGAVASVLVLTKKATMKTAVPFGPYLAGAAILCLSLPSLIQVASSLLGLPIE